MYTQRHSCKYTEEVEQRVVRLRSTHGFGFWQRWGKKGQGAVSTGFTGGLCGATVAHSALGPTCLLTEWCLVTVMVGMGELWVWPLTEPRI